MGRAIIRKCVDCGFHYLMERAAMRCGPCRKRHALATKTSPDALKKAAARLLTKQAIADGRLTKRPCEVCGDARSHVHHLDYDDPLKVEWLCATHHTLTHHRMRWAEDLAASGRHSAEEIKQMVALRAASELRRHPVNKARV